MRVGIIHFYNRSFPPEIRIEKQVPALIDAGHEVRVLTQKISSNERKFEQVQKNYSIQRIKVGKQSLISRINFNRKEYISGLSNFISSFQPDILHVHDFHTVPTVLNFVENNIPVIADLHENMPAAWVAYRSNYHFLKKVIHSVFYNYYIWRYYEKKYLPKCAGILVTVPEAKDVLIHLKIVESKIHIVSNTEDETTFSIKKFKLDKNIENKYKDYSIALYVGGLGPHRGLETTIKAIPMIKNKIANFKLLIVGAKNHEKKEIDKLTRKLKIGKKVEIINWVPFSEVLSYIKLSTVCLVPHDNFEHTQTTIPHKLFQYMIMGKPVLVSDCKPLKRVVEDAKSGLVFIANDSVDLSIKMITLLEDSSKIIKMSNNGLMATKNKYSWQHDKQVMLNVYNSIENGSTYLHD